jgi:MFS family permease
MQNQGRGTGVSGQDAAAGAESGGMFAPLRLSLFRRIWLASLLSNFGSLIQGVGAAWAMTQLTSSASMVALVQTASMMPVLLISLFAGALADVFDRRKIALTGLAFSLVSATALAGLTLAGLITPALLLVFCFAIGMGMSLLGPAWQASVSEQVPSTVLPAAIALNGISYNIARSFGPAIGGVIVTAAGPVGAFGVNAVAYIPLLVVLFLWRREVAPSRLPPETLGRALVSGFRYVLNAPNVWVCLLRTLAIGIIGGATAALMPLIARDILKGGAATYGILLGAFGIGAVLGALNVARVRLWFSAEQSLRLCGLVMGAGMLTIAFSRHPALTVVALLATGACWTLSITQLNVAVQLSAPRWVAGRTLAAFQSAIAGGVAVGSWIWGTAADHTSVPATLAAAGVAMALTPLLGLWLRVPEVSESSVEADARDDPESRLAITGRSGPIVLDMVYRVAQEDARAFYGVMQQMQLIRQRTGAYGWSLARDLHDPELWVERYNCPTWHDYLRQRNRLSQDEVEVMAQAHAFHRGPEPIAIRRMLERPAGSVRRSDEVRDVRPVAVITPVAGPGG